MVVWGRFLRLLTYLVKFIDLSYKIRKCIRYKNKVEKSIYYDRPPSILQSDNCKELGMPNWKICAQTF